MAINLFTGVTGPHSEVNRDREPLVSFIFVKFIVVKGTIALIAVGWLQLHSRGNKIHVPQVTVEF